MVQIAVVARPASRYRDRETLGDFGFNVCAQLDVGQAAMAGYRATASCHVQAACSVLLHFTIT